MAAIWDDAFPAAHWEQVALPSLDAKCPPVQFSQDTAPLQLAKRPTAQSLHEVAQGLAFANFPGEHSKHLELFKKVPGGQRAVGSEVGKGDGTGEGTAEGRGVVGLGVGRAVGSALGKSEGASVGSGVGRAVGK